MTPPLARHAERTIAAALEDTPVVVINGARQVGKSTLVRSLRYPGSVEIVGFDDESTHQAAAGDPRGFLDRGVDTVVIDEAQLVPDIFRAIKASVDRDRRAARFVLTGSSRLLAAPGMADSLVGRVEVIELWPFSQGEIEGSRETFVDTCFDSPRDLVRSTTLSRADAIDRICRGGFPEVVSRRPHRRDAWFDSYLATTTQKVVREIAELERLAEIPQLMRLCAARTGTELNAAALSNELGIPARTGRSYLARLTTAFLVHTIPAWSTNLSSKVVRRPKLHLVDSGLAASLVGATPASLVRSGELLGQLLETFVVGEIRRQLGWSYTRATIWHFRDRSGAEVDIVIERPNGDIVGVEVKATSSPSNRDTKGLRFLAERVGGRFVHGFVVCLAPEALMLGERIAAIPVDRIWNVPG
jgi:hypothetical protein